MACCLEAGTWFCVPTSHRRYILLFWEQLLSPPGKGRAELANAGHNFSPPNIKWTDSKVWVGSSLNCVSQWYTMIRPDKTTLFMGDSGHVTVCNAWPVVRQFHMNTAPLENTPAPYVWVLESVIRTATRWRVHNFWGQKWNFLSDPLMMHGCNLGKNMQKLFPRNTFCCDVN